MTELARECSMDPAAAARQVRALERTGWSSAPAATTTRVRGARLTPEVPRSTGASSSPHHPPRRGPVRLEPRDRTALIRLVDRLVDDLKAVPFRPDQGPPITPAAHRPHRPPAPDGVRTHDDHPVRSAGSTTPAPSTTNERSRPSSRCCAAGPPPCASARTSRPWRRASPSCSASAAASCATPAARRSTSPSRCSTCEPGDEVVTGAVTFSTDIAPMVRKPASCRCSSTSRPTPSRSTSTPSRR